MSEDRTTQTTLRRPQCAQDDIDWACAAALLKETPERRAELLSLVTSRQRRALESRVVALQYEAASK